MSPYLVTVGVLIPLSAWLTLRYGYRRVLLAATAILTLASLGCAASQSLGELLATRVLQAIGGAMMVPVGRMIVFERAGHATDVICRLARPRRTRDRAAGRGRNHHLRQLAVTVF